MGGNRDEWGAVEFRPERKEKGNREDKFSRFSFGTPTGNTCVFILVQHFSVCSL